MITLVFVIVLVCPLPGFSKNVIKADSSHSDLRMDPAPQFHSNDICGDPECNLVCTENQVGDDCCEDLDAQLVRQDPQGCHVMIRRSVSHDQVVLVDPLECHLSVIIKSFLLIPRSVAQLETSV